MGFVFNWYAVVGLVAGPAMVIVAALVFLTRPGRGQNRRLALMVGIEGLGVMAGTGLMYVTDVAASAWAFQSLAVMVNLTVSYLYLRFLATLETPLVSWLKSPAVDRAILTAAVLAPLLFFIDPEFFIAGISPGRYTPWDSQAGPGFQLSLLVTMVTSLFGLAAAISFWRRAKPGTSRRAQGRAYAVAFGIRDIGWVLLVLIPFWGASNPALQFAAGVTVLASVLFVFALALAYGILKTQLFDIDLKIKLGIERSTIAGVFGVAFLVASELVEALVGVEGTLFGVVVAVAIGLFFRRIEAGAERVADAVMPGVEDTAAYREQRKREVYRAALEDAAVDEEVTAKERDVLAGLRENLGLEPGAAESLEREVLRASGGGEAS